MQTKRRVYVAVIFFLTVLFVGSAPFMVDAAQKIVKKMTVEQLVLSKDKSSISRKGDKPVVVKDNLRIIGDVFLQDGAKVDGVDVSALADAVEGLDTSNAVSYSAGEGISISDGVISSTVVDTNTTYTAGTGIDITDGEISSTVNPVSYSAGEGISISDGEISSTVEPGATSLLDLLACSNGQFPRMNGGEWSCSDYASYDSYDNVLTVAKTGAAYGTISAAINAINTAGDAAADNRYVIWVAPGLYEETITLPNYVHIIGASKEAVTISHDDSIFATPLIDAAIGNEIRNVTLSATATSLPGVAVYVNTGEDIALDNVDLTMGGAVAFNFAIFNSGAVVLKDSSITASAPGNLAYGIGGVGNLTMVGSTITAEDATTATGISIQSGSSPQTIDIQSSTITATDGTNCFAFAQTGGSAVTGTITNSVLQGFDCSSDTRGMSGQNGSVYTVRHSFIRSDDGNAVTYGDSPTTMHFGSTQIDGGVAGSTGTAVCAQSYDGSFVDLDATCQ